MKITINPDAVKKQGLEMCDFYALLVADELHNTAKTFNDSFKFLRDNGLLIGDKTLSDSGRKLMNSILDMSTHSKMAITKVKERNTDNLVKELRALWPSGYKDKKWKWNSNETDIKKRLDKFFEDYGYDFTDEQIIEAAKRYVKRFDDSGTRMYQKVLKYFIVSQNGEGSLLADYIEAIQKGESDDLDISTETLF